MLSSSRGLPELAPSDEGSPPEEELARKISPVRNSVHEQELANPVGRFQRVCWWKTCTYVCQIRVDSVG